MPIAATPIAATHPDAGERSDLVRLGLWMFLGTVTMLFAAFTSAYVVRRSGADWQPLRLPPVLWVNTAILLGSSLALEAARRLGPGRHSIPVRVAYLIALTLGIAFLAGQAVAWRQLVAAGLYLPSNPSSSFFFMLTGAHAVHVVAAVGVVAWGTAVTWTVARRDPVRWSMATDVCCLFSHFLFGVWLYLLALVTLY
jgi:cytochrome c oxidase subunit 3